MDTRILTVYTTSPYSDFRGRFIEVPLIRLQGKWLERLGFQAGHKVQVLEHKNKLTIKLVKEDCNAKS